MFDHLKRWFTLAGRDAQLQERLEQLRHRTPVPVFWLLGKTQSGKTSVVRFLTGAEDAEIGQGFRPCTRASRLYQFPTPEAPLLSFIDTRGIDEPDYDPSEDLARFNDQAHVILVVVKALDHAQENILNPLRTIRQAQPSRPVLLLLTCLHEAYPQQQHPDPYPFGSEREAEVVHPDLQRSLAEQQRRFAGLFDRCVPIDLTPPLEGFTEPNYGGDRLKQTLLEVLPAAYRQTLMTLDEGMNQLKDIYARHALPRILGYSTLAATAGAIPVPWLDLLILPAIQTQMIYHLASYYGQPMTARRFVELAGTLGLGLMVRQAAREMIKFIPGIGTVVGSMAASALAGASTFALGKAFCYYYSAVHQGHVPQPEELRRYYREQLALAEQAWAGFRARAKEPPQPATPEAPVPATSPPANPGPAT